MCGCNKNNNNQRNVRSTIGFRSSPSSTVSPATARIAALSSSVTSNPPLTTERRELERKRREAILRRQGKL